MKFEDRYLITSGDEYTVDDILCTVHKHQLKETLNQIAKQALEVGEDLGKVQIWKLTDVRLVSQGFRIEGLDDES